VTISEFGTSIVTSCHFDLIPFAFHVVSHIADFEFEFTALFVPIMDTAVAASCTFAAVCVTAGIGTVVGACEACIVMAADFWIEVLDDPAAVEESVGLFTAACTIAVSRDVVACTVGVPTEAVPVCIVDGAW
jgi:hypothetical protein